jgi:hypothetical protein
MKIEWQGTGYYGPDKDGIYRKIDARNVHYASASNAARDIADGGVIWLAAKPANAQTAD